MVQNYEVLCQQPSCYLRERCRRQSPQSDRPRQLSHGGRTFMSIITYRHSVVADPRTNNRQRPQSPVHCLRSTSEPPAPIYQTRYR
ncbi:hypothetical protein TNCV_3989011 [Trichonephila clavipes]|nr:hypothetical protein TNCV_3989011 [Trichonephila clavipes]